MCIVKIKNKTNTMINYHYYEFLRKTMINNYHYYLGFRIYIYKLV